jgi:hypothetical protein
MNGLRTARVVVIDDKEEEAQPLISALGCVGVPVMYCAGIGKQPPEPLQGIRLVFIDLYMAGIPGIHTNIQTAVELLAQVVDTTEAGVGLILWTTHSTTDKDAFEAALTSRLPNFVPAFIKDQEKDKYTEGDGDYSELWTDIESKLNEEPAHAILRNWEQTAHDAASLSTELIRSRAQDNAELQKILGALAKAGGPINTPSDAVSHLNQGLNTVLMDSVSTSSQLNPGDEARTVQLQEWSRKPNGLSAKTSGTINGVILLDQVAHKGAALRPGNVYTKAWSNNKVIPCPTITFKPSLVFEECVRHVLTGMKDKRDKAVSNGDTQAQLAQEQKINDYELHREQLEYVVVEVTPACDYANGKAPNAKFVGGFLVNEQHLHALKLGRATYTFLRQIGPLRLKRDGQIWHLILNAKLIYARPWPTAATGWSPLCRLREQLLVDVQHWLSSYASRPGYFSVR